MRLDVLEEFVSVARHLNYRKASIEMNVSLPALSKHIAALEDELGFDLFDRDGSVRLTPAGERYLRSAQKVIDELRTAASDCRRIAKADPPARLCWFSRIGLAEAFLRSLQQAGDVPFMLADYDNPTSLRALFTDGLADIVLFYGVEDTEIAHRLEEIGCSTMAIGKDALSLAVMATHPLAEKPELHGADLDGTSLLITGNGLFDDMKAALGRIVGPAARLRFDLRGDIPSFSMMRYSDLGDDALITNREIAHETFGARPDVRLFDEIDGNPLEADICLIYRIAEKNHNARAVIERARSFFANEQKGRRLPSI